jgi:hypothetical protein
MASISKRMYYYFVKTRVGVVHLLLGKREHVHACVRLFSIENVEYIWSRHHS